MPADDVREVTSAAEREAAFPVMQQLFPDLDRSGFAAFFEDHRYRLFAAWDDDTLVGLAGVAVRTVLHHERHAWLHDLVVDADRRREGIGSQLLTHVESWADDRDCGLVALATRTGRDRAQAFYEDRGYEHWGHVYERRP